MSWSVGCGLVFSSAAACMIWPLWQYPHCGTLQASQAFCSGWSPAALSPSMVVMCLPAAARMGVRQLRVASPFTCTVQAPHSPMPQPNLVPVSARSSRRVPEQRHVGIAVETGRLAVYSQLDHWIPLVSVPLVLSIPLVL